MQGNEIKEITYNTKYLSGEALRELTEFTKNKYIVKGATGIGGTTAIFNLTDNNYLIISPNVGMINEKSKKRKEYRSERQFFIYGGSNDNWDDVWQYLKDGGKNCIINTTPNQVLKLYSNKTYKDLYERLTAVNLFVDEIHAYIVENDFRVELGSFMELVYRDWTANYILSTATPIYKFLDIPFDFRKDIEYIKVSPENNPTRFINYSQNHKDIAKFVDEERKLGRLVAIFTNDKKYHVGFKNYKVKNLVGKNLEIKIRGYGRRNNANDTDLFQDLEILVVSSAYFAGWDLDLDCSILIICDQASPATKVSINDCIQAYGRGRMEVDNALFVNLLTQNNKFKGYPKTFDELIPTGKAKERNIKKYNRFLEGFNAQFPDLGEHSLYTKLKNLGDDYGKIYTKQCLVNRGYITHDLIKKIHDWQLYNDNILRETFKEYGFILDNYKSISEQEREYNSTPFKERINNLLDLDIDTLRSNLTSIKYNFKSKNIGSFNSQLALEYTTALFLKVTDAVILLDKLKAKRVGVSRFYKAIDQFIRVNSSETYLNHPMDKSQRTQAERIYSGNPIDLSKFTALELREWHILYAIYKVKTKQYSEGVKRGLIRYEVLHRQNIYEDIHTNKKNRIRDASNAIVKACAIDGVILSDVETVKMYETIDKIFLTYDKDGTYKSYHTINHLISYMIEMLGFLYSQGGKNFKQHEVKNRTYNPITSVSGELRQVMPIKMIESDIVSANAQLTDKTLGTDLGLQVYQNGIDNLRGRYANMSHTAKRNRVKIEYNSTLNNHKMTQKTATKYYLSCGYTQEKAVELASRTASPNKAGAYYELMTEAESECIGQMSMVLYGLGINEVYRFHDGIIFYAEDAENILLPESEGGIRYGLSYFNSDRPYQNKGVNKYVEQGLNDGFVIFPDEPTTQASNNNTGLNTEIMQNSKYDNLVNKRTKGAFQVIAQDEAHAKLLRKHYPKEIVTVGWSTTLYPPKEEYIWTDRDEKDFMEFTTPRPKINEKVMEQMAQEKHTAIMAAIKRFRIARQIA
tara:strand:- start:3029 stop:6118 length:3090 start_codon:yes stop_codon:yes gene_type:complete